MAIPAEGFGELFAGNQGFQASPNFPENNVYNEGSIISIRSQESLNDSGIQQNISHLSHEFELNTNHNTLRSNQQFPVHQMQSTGKAGQSFAKSRQLNQEQHSQDFKQFKSHL